MVKPTNRAEWGTGAAPITEPLLAEKQVGWPVSFKPPAQWFNWWMNLVHLWIVWLDAFESTAHTWSALQTFSAGTAVSSFGVAPGTPGLVGTNALSAGTAVLGSTSAGGTSAGLRGTSSNGGGYGGYFSNTALTGLATAARAYAQVGFWGDGTNFAGVVGSLLAGATDPSAAGVRGSSNTASRPGVAGFGEEGVTAWGGEFVGSAGMDNAHGGLGAHIAGGASSPNDGNFDAGDGIHIEGGDATGDASLGYGSNAGKNTMRGGNVDGLSNDQGTPGIGLELTGGSVTNDSHNRLGATALKLTGGTGQAGRGLALDAVGDAQIAGNARLTGGNVATGTAQINQVSPGLVAKAWAKIRIASGTYTVLAGQNIASVVAGASPTTGQLKVNLAAEVPRATRAALALTDLPGFEVHPYDYAAGLGASDSVVTFEVVQIDASGNRTTLNLSTNTIVFTVVVFGFQ